MLHIFVDADACPVKAEVYRVAARYQLAVTLVSNTWMRSPADPHIRLHVVSDALDAADDWIAEQVAPGDIVVTADLPLADRCIKRRASVISPAGRRLTGDNIGGALATRDLLTGLRSAGERTAGPPPLTKQDRSRFLQALDDVIQAIRRKGPPEAGPDHAR